MAWGPSIKDVGNFFWILTTPSPMAANFYSYPLVNVDKFLTPLLIAYVFYGRPPAYFGDEVKKREKG